MIRRRLPTLLIPALCILFALAVRPFDQTHAEETRISFYKQIRPILQANCQGCHQPARSDGGYVMTSFEGLSKGGESELPAVVAEKPDESYIIDMITPFDGEAAMPQDKPPLSSTEIDLIRQWIVQGAVDDTPESARQRYDMDHPPQYRRAPVITSMAFSPNGQLLAISGFHEVFLVETNGYTLVGRLVGLSERIESVQFSPDGNRIAVTGGLPCRMGEVQIWNVEDQSLELSVPITFDTVYGGKWSPDGTMIAFGCADHTVRAIDADTGEQILYQGAHNDWVLDTIFTKDGSYLVSVGRDMSCKLTEVATERFVDNITSITPGLLKGGIQSVARHPERDEIVIGGSDGVVKVFRVHRLTERKIGDDANLIRRMPPLKGRVFGVAVSSDGKRIAAVSSLDGAGQLGIYGYEFDTSLPEEIKKIQRKTVSGRSSKEKKKLEAYRTRNVQVVATIDVPESGLYSVAFHPNNESIATAGLDGIVRIVSTDSGEIVRRFSPAPIEERSDADEAEHLTIDADAAPDDVDKESGKDDGESVTFDASNVKSLIVHPQSIDFENRFEYAQLVVTAELASGDFVDTTRAVRYTSSTGSVEILASGVVVPKGDGQATISIRLGNARAKVPVAVSGLGKPFQADFARDVSPLLSHLGCTLGTCHGSAKGKNGFKLSLRGYDPVFDVRSLTDDLASRRVNVASPDESLMLLKATGSVPHVGSQLTQVSEPYYEIIRNWIAHGAKLNRKSPRVTGIELFPKNPVVQRLGDHQQVRVVATYADGETRDVTREAFVESGNTEVATIGQAALLTSIRRGEAPILARYEGAYAATTLTVMGDRTGFVWKEPEAFGQIDKLVSDKWQRMKIQPSELCEDVEFIRRVYLDLTGVPPTSKDVRRFLADNRDTKEKRDALIDRLVGSVEYVEHWTNKWADLLQVNRKYLGAGGAASLRRWIRTQIVDNKPYDEFVREILTASGSNQDNPAASYYKTLRTAPEIMENTTHLFLAVRFNCNRCHDHPFERWTQDQYYQTAAYFARVGLKRDPASGDKRIGGTAVESPKPLYEIVYDNDEGEIKHDRTGRETAPQFPFPCDHDCQPDATRREQLAQWMTSPDNPYFARSYVNRLWGYLLGVGIIDPIDDIRAGNPPSNPELLDYLTRQFVGSGFNVHHMMRLICKSRTYQLSIETNKWNEEDDRNYSHAIARRLPAEVIYDSVHKVTGSESRIPGVRPGTRAAELPDSGVKLPSGFLANLGRPPRESACECERSNELQLGPIMAMISGPTVGEAIADPNNSIAELVERESDDNKLINELFLRILNRPAKQEEIKAALDSMNQIESDHERVIQQFNERKRYVKAMLPKWEKARADSIARVQAELAEYEKELAPKLKKLEKERAEKIASVESDLKMLRDGLKDKLASWEEAQTHWIDWHPLVATRLWASNGARFVRQPDRSIFVDKEKAGKGSYTLEAETTMGPITGVRLEALADNRLPNLGPGLADNGNFVITEFEVEVAPRSKPNQWKMIKLTNGKSDFSQSGFDVKQAIDGKDADQKGWAVNPSGGVVHWAVFDFEQPLEHPDGLLLKFTIHQNHNAKSHRLGRFRLSVTKGTGPLELGLPEPLQALVLTQSDRRSDEQRQVLIDYLGAVDSDILKTKKELADARKPIPEDPGLKQLRRKLKIVSRPLSEDSRLAQLRQALKQSEKQRENKRLTGAQDLAWALINTPEFLFNR